MHNFYVEVDNQHPCPQLPDFPNDNTSIYLNETITIPIGTFVFS